MAYDRFMIAPLQSGLETDLKAWQIPDDAFAVLNNAYVFRGRVRKRFGSTLIGLTPLNSRLRVNLGNTDGAGAKSGTAPGAIFKIGQMFSIGTVTFTVTNLGVAQPLLRSDGSASAATFDTTNGAYVIAGAPLTTAMFYYPAEPVMGFSNYEQGPVNDQPSYAFDTQFAYTFAGGSWSRSATSGVPTWHGDNSDFVWVANWEGVTANIVSMFVTNFNAAIGTASVNDDPMYKFDGSTWTPFSYLPNLTTNPGNVQPLTVTRTTPASTGAIIASYVQSALLVIPFKDRLLLLNTIENNANGATAFNTGSATTTGITPTNYATSTNTQYPQRLRFSQNGSPLADNAWIEPNAVYKPNTGATTLNAAGGGFIDATTEEQIISAEFIKDRLIVYFERSTWEIVYTGNEVQPFLWQKINTELGSEATFSSVPFDKIILTVGTTGVHACNGANVERIDNKIPDDIFQLRFDNNGLKRIAGIRDYFTEMVYWTFPMQNAPAFSYTYPNKVLVYNYKNGSWGFNDDVITAFGYFEQQAGATWESLGDLTWEQANFPWNSGAIAPNFRQIIAGNQQGFVFIVEPDVSRNAPCMQITNMTINANGTVTLVLVDHTLTVGDYIALENLTGVIDTAEDNYPVIALLDANTVVIRNPFISGTYLGGGTVARVSNIGIQSKQWNPYAEKDRNLYLAKINFCVDTTDAGEVTVEFLTSSANLAMVNESINSGAILGNSILETFPYPSVPLESYQERVWHPVYFQAEGQNVQIFIYMSDEQMADPDIAWEDFQLEGLILYTTPTSARMQ